MLVIAGADFSGIVHCRRGREINLLEELERSSFPERSDRIRAALIARGYLTESENGLKRAREEGELPTAGNGGHRRRKRTGSTSFARTGKF